jgi:hypothetical protein
MLVVISDLHFQDTINDAIRDDEDDILTYQKAGLMEL